MKKYSEDYKEKINKAKLSSLTKEVNKETKNLRRLKQQRNVAKTPEEREKLDTYIDTLEGKIKWVLEHMTKDKMASANLAQLSKALRILTDRSVRAKGGEKKISEQRKLSVNINVEDMSKDDLLKLLSEKSQQYEK